MPFVAPNFYKIDCDREVVLQGKTSFYFTIARNDISSGGIPGFDRLAVVIYPQPYTFETHGIFPIQVTSTGNPPTPVAPLYGNEGFVLPPLNTGVLPEDLNFNKITPGLAVKNYRDFGYIDPFYVYSVNEGTGEIVFWDGINVPPQDPAYNPGDPYLYVPNPLTFAAGTYTISTSVGVSSPEDGDHWLINGRSVIDTSEYINNGAISSYLTESTVENPFDGTLAGPLATDGTGYISRASVGQIIVINSANTPAVAILDRNNNTRSVTIRLDYDGEVDAHLKLNLLLAITGPVATTDINALINSVSPQAPFGLKTANWANAGFTDVDYQELHFFGYPEGYVRPNRDEEPFPYQLDDRPIYDDRASYGLLKTNPKLSGNVKITTDSNGDIWLNSFDANDELSDSAYKKFSISSASTYQKDLYTFFKNGKTPSDIVFDLYQVDDQYLNNKQTFDQQFDNFYNYGVEQLRSKFYDEDFSFLAPLWLRKDTPDFFVIFRVNHPFNEETYTNDTVLSADKFRKFFQDARIVKTFDLRNSSKLGSYINKIVNDPRFRERPLEVSWDKETPTFWYGISYQNGTMSSKGEFLYDFYTVDRPIKEFEEYITDGFQRNGIVSTNLLNLEFLFNDEEADLYSINRYFGFYVRENQLAEFEIEPQVLGKIANQSPEPKPGVDGEPYSTRSFIQTNPDGIQLPVHYYHNDRFTNNTTNIPSYQGFVIGKFPLPSMVDDPLRIFYVKDRNDIFKRAIQLSEVDYGNPGTTDYIRATQIKLFDNQEDISKYGGVSDIVSQFPASLLEGGNSQLRVHFFDQFGTGVLANDEELQLKVVKYNDQLRFADYHIQLIATDNATFATVQYFIDQRTDQVQNLLGFTQPAVNASVNVSVIDSTQFIVNEKVFIVSGGYYLVNAIISPTAIELINLGGSQNAAPGSTIALGCIIGEALTGEATYILNPIDYKLQIDNYLTIDLAAGFALYAPGDAWNVKVEYPNVTKTLLTGVNPVDATYRIDYEQFTWKMIANGVGLQPGDAWDYPQYDPDGQNQLSHFSNEGTAAQVARAVAKCVNSFENAPAIAWADGDAVYFRSKLAFEEGNSLQFIRIVTQSSYYANVGFYERGNVFRGITSTQKSYTPLSTTNLSLQLIKDFDQPVFQKGYYLKFIKGPWSVLATFRYGADVSSYANATSTGTLVLPFIVPLTTTTFSHPQLPFSLDIRNLPNGVSEFAYEVSTTKEVVQTFVGGVKRNRNRVQISAADSQNYWQNQKVVRSATITTGSSTITVDTTGLYVGAPIVGTGIPEGAKAVDVNTGSLIMDKIATATGTFELTLGEISILNSTPIFQQWYQSLKGTYSRMKAWDVQGKLVYTLPYLDKPTFDQNEIVNGFTEYNTTAIIQLEKTDQEFYYSIDNRVVAYKLYRPVLGVFSLFPIKQFDFDFFFSDYSYTPTIEALKYFEESTADYTSTTTAPIELDVFQNYVISVKNNKVPVANASLTLTIEAYTAERGWQMVDEVNCNSVNSTVLNGESKWIINTFYPFYDYDAEEFPFTANSTSVPSLTDYAYRSAGYRNFDRRYLYTSNSYLNGTATKGLPLKFRIKPLATSPLPPGASFITLHVRNYNYQADQDVTDFNGFAGLQDITSVQDADVIQAFKEEGKFIESYTYQLLLSEYDRLRENYNKDWAVKSKVVPYITKWVQEGTDARDNYYRFNNSLAFGLTNLSPIESVDFVEPAVLTHEFPYLDAFPQAYPEENISSSRSYMYNKLSDVAALSKSWYELLTSNNENDWFTKYFAIGYPTELDYQSQKNNRAKEERYTFFNYIDGIGRSQTLFRGAKIQPIVYDDTDPQNIVEISSSNEFNGYKFSAVARFENYDFYQKQNPVDIEIVRNAKYKTVVMIITIRLKDYRWQYGGSEYMAQYFMNDLLTNSHQQQFDINTSTVSPYSLSLRNFLPYNSAPTYPGTADSSYATSSILRPRQGFMGGGYLRLGDKKLSGLTVDRTTPLPITPNWVSTPLTIPQLTVEFMGINSDYEFKLLEEIYPIANRYRFTPNQYVTFTPGYVNPREFGKDGYLFSIVSSYKNANETRLRIRNFVDSQFRPDNLQVKQIQIGSSEKSNRFDTLLAPNPLTANLQPTSSPTTDTDTVFPPTAWYVQETYNLEGGTNGFNSLQAYLTFANIYQLVNNQNSNVRYYNVTDTGKAVATNFAIQFVSPDSIIKTGVLHYALDEDKPDEYKNKEYVGYDIVNTLSQEYMIRHRGFYEPKSRDIISFWVREDNAFTRHYETDFLLSNTHIDANSSLSGLIKNYGFNKVSGNGNIMQIARSSAYQSLYPLIDEVAVASADYFSLDSSWDNKFYRKYIDTVSYTDVEGIIEMKEFKTFMASKTMIVPKSFELHTFNTNEVTFELIQPDNSIGVSELVTDTTARNQSRPNAERPKLVIRINLRRRLLRELLEEINSIVNIDEFERLKTVAGTSALLNSLTPQQIDALKTSYFEKNIIDLYEPSDVVLYQKVQSGIELLNINLTEQEKTIAGYQIDKNCVVQKLSAFDFEITKTLDPKVPSGFSLATTLTRI